MLIRTLVRIATGARLLQASLGPAGTSQNDIDSRTASSHFQSCVLASISLHQEIDELPVLLENTILELTRLSRSILAKAYLLEIEDDQSSIVDFSDVQNYSDLKSMVLHRCADALRKDFDGIRRCCIEWIEETDELLILLEQHYQVYSFRGTVRRIFHILNESITLARRREFKPHPISIPSAVQLDVSTFTAAKSISSILTGLLYLMIFLPLVLRGASSLHISFVDVILLNFLNPSDGLFNAIRGTQGKLVLYCFATFYGVTSIIYSLLNSVVNFRVLTIKANGLFLGFYVTILVDIILLGNFKWAMIFGVASLFKFAYVLLVYYLIEVSIEVSRRLNKYPDKYEDLFRGLYGLLTGWILARGFGESAVIFNGLIFTFLTFFTMWWAEVMFRWSWSFISVITGIDMLGTLNTLPLFDGKKPLFGMEAFKNRKAVTFGALVLPINAGFPLLLYYVLKKLFL